MKTLLFYLLQVFVISGLLYTYYHVALRNNKFHRYNRFYLLVATIISIAIPFFNIPIYFTESQTQSSFVFHTLNIISDTNPVIVPKTGTPIVHHPRNIEWTTIIKITYLIASVIFLVRIIMSLLYIRKLIITYKVQKLDSIRFINTAEPGTPFSIFKWLFWNNKIDLNSEKGAQIFRHELFHIEQKHSRDVIFIEMILVIFWINPFFHLIKKEIKAIHEFLADKFAVNENKKWEYAELLLMHTLNTNYRLVNPFFNNQIKRRIAMLTTSSKPGHRYLRRLMVLPLIASVIMIFAFSYKTNYKESGQKGTMAGTKQFQFLDVLKDTSGKVLVIIDGKMYPKLEVKNIDQIVGINDIATINVLKADVAVKKYGEQANNGAIEIITKKQGSKLNPDSRPLNADSSIKTIEIFNTTKIDSNQPTDSSTSYRIATRNLDPRTLYIGVDNTFRIISHNVDDVKFFSIEGEEIIKKEDKLVIRVTHPTEEVKLRLYIDNNGKAEAMKEYSFAVRPLPNGLQQNASTSSLQNMNLTFVETEIPPTFPGGSYKFSKYIESKVPGVDGQLTLGSIRYSIPVQFVVDVNGHLSNVKTVEEADAITEAGRFAVDLIRHGPPWIPARQNGIPVRALTTQTVEFYNEVLIKPTKPNNSAVDQKPYLSVKGLRNATVYGLLELTETTTILSYTFTIDRTDEIVQVLNTGNTFNTATRGLIQGASAGRLLTLDNIRILENGKEKKIPSKMWYITD